MEDPPTLVAQHVESSKPGSTVKIRLDSSVAKRLGEMSRKAKGSNSLVRRRSLIMEEMDPWHRPLSKPPVMMARVMSLCPGGLPRSGFPLRS